MKKYSNENLVEIASLIVKVFNNNTWQYQYLKDNNYELLFTRMKANSPEVRIGMMDIDDIRLNIYGNGKNIGYVNIVKKDQSKEYSEDEIRDDVDDLLVMISLFPDTYYTTLEY